MPEYGHKSTIYKNTQIGGTLFAIYTQQLVFLHPLPILEYNVHHDHVRNILYLQRTTTILLLTNHNSGMQQKWHQVLKDRLTITLSVNRG